MRYTARLQVDRRMQWLIRIKYLLGTGNGSLLRMQLRPVQCMRQGGCGVIRLCFDD